MIFRRNGMRVIHWIGVSLIGAVIFAAVSCSKEESKPATGGGESGGAAPAAGAKIIKASDPSALKLAFVTNNASEFWKIAAAGVHKYEKEAGIQVDIKMPPNGKPEEQNGFLENLVSQGYNGIAE
jgi:ribose transport system substrate-binding protein